MKPSLNHVQTFGHVVEQQEQRQQWNSGEQFLLTLSINFAERPALSRYSNIKHQNILTPVTMKVKIQLSNSCSYYSKYISVKVDPHVSFPHKYCYRHQLKPSQQPINSTLQLPKFPLPHRVSTSCLSLLLSTSDQSLRNQLTYMALDICHGLICQYGCQKNRLDLRIEILGGCYWHIIQPH